MNLARRLVYLVAVAGVVAGGLAMSRGDQQDKEPAGAGILTDGFETPQPVWQREYTDTTVRLHAHDRSNRASHGGQLSEHFQFESGIGSQFFVSYALPRVLVTSELSLSLYVRSNKQGVHLYAKVILPADIDPVTKAPSYVLLPGTVFSRVDRWENLELKEMLPAIEQQARVLRATTRRPVQLDGAYLDRVVVNLMGGAGETEVFLDDLAVAPVPRELAAEWSRTIRAAKVPSPARKGRSAPKDGDSSLPAFRLNRFLFEKLRPDKRYVGWFPTAVDAPGADITKLRGAGNDVLVTDANPDPRAMRAAVEGGFFLLPRLDGTGGVSKVLAQMAAYPEPESVVAWHLGDHLGRHRVEDARKRELDEIREVLTATRAAEDGNPRLTTATVDGEYRQYARSPSNLDVMGIQPPLWGTALSMQDGYTYLLQRRYLTVRSNPEALFWVWLPTTAPPGVVRNIWGDDTPPEWGTPPVQPEQLRLMTYVALSAGYRGLTYMGDADLTRPSGEPLLIEMSLLNAEIDLCEQILARNLKKINPYEILDPDPLDKPTIANSNQKRMPKVAERIAKPGLIAAPIALDSSRGFLMLVTDFAGGAQWQPPQMAYRDLTITPALPQGAQIMEISPGDARFLEWKMDDRVPGGLRITLQDFGVSTILLCTTDIALCKQIQEFVQRIRPRAIALAIRQAEIQFSVVSEVHERLKADGHGILNEKDLKRRTDRGISIKPPDADDLLAQTDKFLKNAQAARDAEDYPRAWSEARRASRPLRLVMFGYWQQALAEFQETVSLNFNPKPPELPEGQPKPYPPPPVITTASSCPPAISFYTLPQLFIWKDWIKGRAGFRFGANRVPSGSFDDKEDIGDSGWTDVSFQHDQISHEIAIVSRKEPRPPKPAEKQNQPKGKKDEVFLDPVIADSDHAIKMTVAWKNREEMELSQLPFLDFPVAAIRSPTVRVQANNLIQISVLVKRSIETVRGAGGVIIRDSIGGEQFQYRNSDPIPGYSRVVLYRKAPADENFYVTLGLAGYGEVLFDDFRVQVIEEDPRFHLPDPNLVQDRQGRPSTPGLPSPRMPAESANLPSENRRQQR
jgi:hypothetical protein